MAILIPSHLLEQAERLLEPRKSGRNPTLIRQVDRRRAISAAYYAVFHFVLTAVADELVGSKSRRTALYALVYRSVDHKSLEGLCRIAARHQLSDKYASYAPIGGLASSIRLFASLLIDLKEKRNSADYDPSYRVELADVKTAISAARRAMALFEKATVARRKAFLTLLAFPPR